jgi:anti-sigma regulatory factor (Ser/Thr protein kinase)
MTLNYTIAGGDFAGAGNASSAVKSILKQLNIESGTIKRVVISLYEAEVNVAAHADNGIIRVDIDSASVKMVIRDSGPGIADIDQAMEEGFSTASAEVREMGFGAGMGLPNIKRNCDLLNIKSVPGEGTELIIEIFLNQANQTES